MENNDAEAVAGLHRQCYSNYLPYFLWKSESYTARKIKSSITVNSYLNCPHRKIRSIPKCPTMKCCTVC